MVSYVSTKKNYSVLQRYHTLHGKIFKRHALKTARKNSFSQRVINDWNSLPTDVIESPSIDIYKNRLDKHWQHLHKHWQHLHYVTTD